MSSFSDKAKQIISTVAPLLGTALGGPLGGMAGTLLSNALGVPPGDDKALEAAVTSGNPDLLLKLKQADQDFAAKMKELDIQESQLAYQDTANARDREIKTGDWTPRILAGLVVVGWLFVQFFLLHHIVDQSMRELVARVLGTLDAALMLVLNYYFGSSASSRQKDETLATIAKGP